MLPRKKKETEVEIPVVEEKQNTPETEFFVQDKFSRSYVQPLWATNSNSFVQAYSVEQITKLLNNPQASYKHLQGVSNYLYNINSNYANILDYFANLLTFDFALYPIGTEKVNPTTTKTRMLASAKIINKIQPQNLFPIILKSALKDGETYYYDLSDNENTILVEIPKEICRLSQIDDDGLWRYFVDLSLITPLNIIEYPEEIQTAYKEYQGKIEAKKIKKGDKRTDEPFVGLPHSYYEVSKKGFAVFIHMKKLVHDYPYFVQMFTDLLMLSNDKLYFNEFTKDDAVKTLHLQVPTDKESGKPLMDRGVIQAYHDATKSNVGSNISVITTPFKVEGIALDKNQQNSMNIVKHDSEVIASDSGVSTTVFNSDSTNGLGFSTEKDAAKMYPLLMFFTNYVNYKIKAQKCQVTFLRTNIYNRADIHEQYRTDLLSGGSRLLFISTSGVDLYTYMNLLEAEQQLDIDEILIPKLNGSQMSSDSAKNGRPELDTKDAKDSTNKEKEYR